MNFSKKTVNYELISGGAWALSSKVMLAIVGLVINALLTRLLTPQEVGAYFLTLTLVGCASMLAQLGLDHAVVRLIAESLGLKKFLRARKAIFKALLLLSCGIITLALVLFCGLGDFLATRLFNSSIISEVIDLTVIWFVAVAFQGVIAEIFRGFQDIRYASIFGGLFSKIISVLLFAILWICQGHSDLKQVLIISAIGGLTSVFISGVLIFQKIKKYDIKKDGNSVNDIYNKLRYREILMISLPLLLSNISNFILTQSDIWIVGAFHTQETVAIFGAATRLILLITMPVLAVHAVVTPLIANLYAQKRNTDIEITLRASAAAAIIPSILIFLSYVIFGRFLLEFVFGDFYKAGYLILVILCFGQMINIWAGSCGYALMMTGYQNRMMYISLISGFVAIVLGILLAGPYGAEGVAVATSTGLSLRAIAMWLCVKKALGIWTHISFKKLYQIKSLRMLMTDD